MLPQFVVDGRRGPPWRPLGIHTAVVFKQRVKIPVIIVDVESSQSSLPLSVPSYVVEANAAGSAGHNKLHQKESDLSPRTNSTANSNNYPSFSTKRVFNCLTDTNSQPSEKKKKSHLLSPHSVRSIKDPKPVNAAASSNNDDWLMNTSSKYLSIQSKRNRGKQTSITDAFKPLQFQVKGRKL